MESTFFSLILWMVPGDGGVHHVRVGPRNTDLKAKTRTAAALVCQASALGLDGQAAGARSAAVGA